ncbi:hypothetical protein BDA96_03G215500, partial [Sorghum bicolor]
NQRGHLVLVLPPNGWILLRVLPPKGNHWRWLLLVLPCTQDPPTSWLSIYADFTKVWATGRNARRLPPGPRGLPLIGNLHQVGALPHRALRSLAATHGAPDLMQLRLGHVLALVASSPAAAAALMREHDGAFGTRPYFRTAEILTYGFQDLVFAPHGEHWRHVRRLCSAHVLSAVRSHSFDGMREREVAALVRTMRERAGGVVDMSKALYGFANGVICRAVSGTGRGLSREEEEEEEEEGRRSELFRALIEVNTALLGGFCVGDYFPSLAWMDDALSGAGARAWRNLKRWDDLLEKVVQEHEARRRRRGDGDVEVEEEDFVDVLLAVVLQAEEKQDHDGGFELTSDAIKSLLADMFAAGTERRPSSCWSGPCRSRSGTPRPWSDSRVNSVQRRPAAPPRPSVSTRRCRCSCPASACATRRCWGSHVARGTRCASSTGRCRAARRRGPRHVGRARACHAQAGAPPASSRIGETDDVAFVCPVQRRSVLIANSLFNFGQCLPL